MKLNYDCLRDVLLYLESIPAYDENGKPNSQIFTYGSLHSDSYSDEDTTYVLSQLYLSGMIVGQDWSSKDGFCLNLKSISPVGHEFLNNIKNDTVWNKVKENVKQFGELSIPILSSLAGSIVSKMLGI